MRPPFHPGLLLASLCATALHALHVLHAAEPPSVDKLSLEETDSALEAIWRKTPEPERRSPESAKRAALQAYLERLGPGTALLNEVPAAPSTGDFPPYRFHSEVLPGKTAYIRLGLLGSDSAAELEPVLRDFHQLGARNLILDLRATPPSGSLADASALATCFVPNGARLFAIRSSTGLDAAQSTKEPVARFKILLLTGPRTEGPVEALAGLLKLHCGAILLGSPTGGQAADFELVPLQNGRFLRLPVRQAVLTEFPNLFPDGLQPDIPSPTDAASTDAALLHAAKEGRVAALLQETERPRLNEAALIAGKNPVLEAWIQSQLSPKTAAATPPPKDTALRAAMDFLSAWEALHGQVSVLP